MKEEIYAQRVRDEWAAALAAEEFCRDEDPGFYAPDINPRGEFVTRPRVFQTVSEDYSEPP